MELPINQIMNGDALTHLKELPDQSINMVMTSPPYWALRDYGSSVETIWDSLAESVGVECKHEWTDEIPYAKRDERTPEQKKAQGATVGNSINSENFAKGNSGRFCLRCKAWKGQLGLEPTFDLYIKHLCDIFDETKRVLKDEGIIFINLGDTYMGNSSYSKEGRQGYEGKDGMINKKQWLDPKYPHKEKLRAREHIDCNLPNKSLCMIPFRFAIEMVNRGWVLRNTIIWHKPNAMPSSVKDRFNVDFEYLFFFSKKKDYYFEQQFESFKSEPTKLRDKRNENYGKAFLSPLGKGLRNGYEQGARNKRTVWEINTKPLSEAHFATYPEELCETPIKAGCPEGGVVLDMFFGAGTTGLVALKQNKKFIGIELNPEYIQIANKRLEPYLLQSKLFVKAQQEVMK